MPLRARDHKARAIAAVTVADAEEMAAEAVAQDAVEMTVEATAAEEGMVNN